MKLYITKIHYSNKLIAQDQIIMSLLSCLSIFYNIAVRIRNFFYDKNLIKPTKLNAYVVSIGNLTTGGTGKTPLTMEIARYFKENLNKKVVILSHGYGGRLSVKGVNLISDGKNIFSTPDLAGDEPWLIASNLADIPVLTSKNRINSGKYAIDKLGAEVLILDDGFQHRKLYRDLNLLVVDLYKKFGNNRLLPAGPLREPLGEIKRADKVLIVSKKPNDRSETQLFQELTAKFNDKYSKKTFLCRFKPGEIFNIKNNDIFDPLLRVYAFAAIAQPEFFFNYLKNKNITLAYTREYSDHHIYSEEDLLNMLNEAKKLDAQALVTTEKDAVKLIALIGKSRAEIPIFALKLKVEADICGLLENS